MFYRYEHYMSISHMALIVGMEHGAFKIEYLQRTKKHVDYMAF